MTHCTVRLVATSNHNRSLWLKALFIFVFVRLPSQNNVCNGTVLVPSWVMQQLAARNRSFPVAWQEAEKYVPWLAPGRLLLFVDCGESTSTTFFKK